MPAALFVLNESGSSPRVDRTMAAMEWDHLLHIYDGDRVEALRHIADEQEWDTLDIDPLAPYDITAALDLLDSGHGIEVVLERLRGWHEERVAAEEAEAEYEAAEQTQHPCPHCGGTGWVDD